MKISKRNQTVVIESKEARVTYTQIKYVRGNQAKWQRVTEFFVVNPHTTKGFYADSTRRVNEDIAYAIERAGYVVTVDGVVNNE